MKYYQVCVVYLFGASVFITTVQQLTTWADMSFHHFHLKDSIVDRYKTDMLHTVSVHSCWHPLGSHVCYSWL